VLLDRHESAPSQELAITDTGLGSCSCDISWGVGETMTNLVDKQCKSVDWFTPPEILEPVRKLFGGDIFLDPCTTYDNPTGAIALITEEQDGLSVDYWYHGTFVNPPYGKQLYDWIEKTVAEATRGHWIVLLVSASSRWDQDRWQKIFSPNLTAMCMPRGRVKFLNADGVQMKSPPYPSLLFFYNIDPVDVQEHFGEIGKVVKIDAI